MEYNKNGEWEIVLTRRVEKGKGCDIGYALVASYCEVANSVDACTVTAFDAATAFAVPNPNWSSQTQSVFSGLDARPGHPVKLAAQPTSVRPNFI
jgi:hypothetical protein